MYVLLKILHVCFIESTVLYVCFIESTVLYVCLHLFFFPKVILKANLEFENKWAIKIDHFEI